MVDIGIPNFDAYIIIDESNLSHYYSNAGFGIYLGISSKKDQTNGEDDHLTVGTDDSFTWHRVNGIKYTFNQQLQYIKREDGSGNIQSLTYDADGRVETVTDEASGRSIAYAYNANGRIESITGPSTTAVADGIWVRYQYDAEGNLTRVIYADDDNGSASSGFEYRYEDPYDEHNITEKRNLAGELISSWAYDNEDRAIENFNRDGKGVTISGYDTGNIEVVNGYGSETTYTIDLIYGGHKRITEIAGDTCSSCGEDGVFFRYDKMLRVDSMQRANGRIDEYKDFDTMYRYQTEVQAVGTVDEKTIYYTYHPATGDKLSITESSILGDGDKVIIFDYDDDGNAAANENPTRSMHRMIERGFTFDGAGTVIPYEHVTLYTYTTRGQVESIDGPLPGDQDKITYTYDPVTGDRLTATRPLVGTTTFTYDAAGNVATITDVNNIVTTITYDGRNRQLAATRNGATTSRTFTSAGETATTTDALNRTMAYTYNAPGFVEKIIDPSGKFIYYGYKSYSQRDETSIFAADGTQTLYQGTGYIKEKPWKSIRRNADDTADLETVYAYDVAGNLTSVTDANENVTTYSYDLFNRLHHVLQPGNVTTYDYDAQGNLTTVTEVRLPATS